MLNQWLEGGGGLKIIPVCVIITSYLMLVRLGWCLKASENASAPSSPMLFPHILEKNSGCVMVICHFSFETYKKIHKDLNNQVLRCLYFSGTMQHILLHNITVSSITTCGDVLQKRFLDNWLICYPSQASWLAGCINLSLCAVVILKLKP